MKQRFSSLDVKVIAQELSYELRTLRLSNIYDLSSRIFLFKFAKPDNRQSLVIDSGFRCHLTEFARATASTPSSFTVRLRKFLRTRRVTSVAQVGTDRIIELQFSDGQYRLFLEFYAGGNIVLTDKELSILALFRIVAEGPDQEELRVGLKYSLDNCQNYAGVPQLTSERVREGLHKALDKSSGSTAEPPKKSKKTIRDALQKALARSLNEFPPMLLDHALRMANFDPATLVENVLRDEDTLKQLLFALQEAKRINESVAGLEVCKGYIIARFREKRAHSQQHNAQTKDSVESQQQSLVYDDFQPFRPRQFEDDPGFKILEFDGFNKTVDEFFSSIESQKLQSRLTEREEHAKKKLETAKQDHEKRLGGLQQVQELNVRRAQAIEGNLQRVQEAIAAVNSLVAQSIGWPEIARLVEMEHHRNNPVAEMIKLPLKLHENTVTLLLAEANFEDEADFEGNETDSEVSDSADEDSKPSKYRQPKMPSDKRLAVDVDLALSPWSNARQYYDQKKTAAVKEQRTMQSSERALKSTERKINADLQKGLKHEKDVLRPQRKALWFEKFTYFISSEGYLVLGGKDSLQNDIIYKKYLKKGDTYVHADLQGAASVIVKNKPGRSDDPIPPSTLAQAGTLVVCTSSAWDSKAVMSAWWVHADQVSKFAGTGEYMQPGSFGIKGQKNFLPPTQLLLGFGLVFKISEESKGRHLKHRIQDDDEEASSKPTIEMDDAAEALKDLIVTDPQGKLNIFQENDMKRRKVYQERGGGDENTAELFENHDSADSDEDEEDYESETHNPLQTSKSQQPIFDHNPANLINTAVSSGSGSEVESELDADNAIEEGETGPTDEGEPKSRNAANKGGSEGIRHLSANERRLIRKSQHPEALEDDSELSTYTALAKNLHIPSQESSKQAKPPRHIRGKVGKTNKLKNKYADQDDEDRALAMRLLGSAAGSEKAKEDMEAKASKEEELVAAKERRRKQHKLAAEQGKEADEKRRRDFEEGNEAFDEDDLEGTEDLDAFVGMPLPGDEILDALVICGPWDAIGGRCRWRVKLQPGSMKKGKAVREILGAWNAALTVWEKKKRPSSEEGNATLAEEDRVKRREAELIRGIREPEVIGVVPVGKVRVMMGTTDRVSKPRGGSAAGKGKRGGKGSKRI